jgi:hypothetical protein
VAEALVATVHIALPVFPTSMGSRMLKKSWLKAVLCSRARLLPCGEEAARARALKSFAVISRISTSTAAILAVAGSSCALSNNTAVNELIVLNSILACARQAWAVCQSSSETAQSSQCKKVPNI